jgi:hypothetical protein
LPLWFSPSLSWSYEVRINGERVVFGFEIEKWGLEKWHGWPLCGRSPKFNWKKKLEERVYIYILSFFLFLKKKQMSLLFVLHYVTSVLFFKKKDVK